MSVDKKLNDIRSRVQGVKGGPDKFTFRCPVHDDQQNSASASLSEDKTKILLHCHVGCAAEEIVDALGMKMNDLFIESTAPKQKVSERIHSYHDPGGVLLYRKTRVDYSDGTKAFFFAQRNGTKDVKDVQRVPYNLPSIANAKTVYFVEGEKCADALIKLGRVATTLDGGANSTWRPEYDGCFDEKDVIILPDNDVPGMKYAEMLKEKIPRARIVLLPGLPSKGDIYDWLSAGHTLEELDALPSSEESPVTLLGGEHVHIAVQPINKPKALETYTADTLYGKEFERPPAIITGLLHAGLAILAGAPKRGKSWLMLWLAICVSLGAEFLGMRSAKGDVLYLDLESRQYRVADRLGVLMAGRAPAGLHIAHDAACIGDGLVEQLAEWCDSVGLPRLIIVDTFQRVKPPARRVENAYEADYRILDGLQRFAMDRGIAIVLVHHLRKATYSTNTDPLEKISGSMGISGSCDTIFLLDGDRESKDGSLCVEGRDIERASLAVRFDNGVWTCLGADSTAYNEQKEYRESPVVVAVRALMDGRERWEGTAPELLDDLYEQDVLFPDGFTVDKLGTELSKHSKRLLDDEITITRRRDRRGKKTVRLITLLRGANEEEFDL